MNQIARFMIATGAVVAAIGVALGAFGAHGLSDFLTGLGFEGDDLHRRSAIFETAVRYQMMHAIAIVITGLLLNQHDCRCWRFAAYSFLVGLLIFSGLLEVLTIAGPSWRWLGAIVPVGGVLMIVGWVALAVGAIRK